MRKLTIFLAGIFLILLVSCAQQYTKTDIGVAGPLIREQYYQETIAIKEESNININIKNGYNISNPASFPS